MYIFVSRNSDGAEEISLYYLKHIKYHYTTNDYELQ